MNIPYGYCHCGCGQKTNAAKQTITKLGHVRGEPTRYICGHHGVPRPLYTVDSKTGCWNWQRAKTSNGYGVARERGKKQTSAHRVYYERTNGPIASHLDLHHLCENKACVNPAHLEPITRTDHIRKGVRIKLSIQKAREIRRLRKTGLTMKVIAARFGIAPTTVQQVVEGKTWRE